MISFSYAQISFNTSRISTSLEGGIGIFAIDIDDDGDKDIISSHSSDDDKIVLHENNGSKTFTTRTIAESINGESFIFAIDLDQDGDVDVLSSSLTDQKIRWHDNDGSENFTEKTVASGVSAQHVFAIDLDQDGDIDIVVPGNGILWYENNGSESFTARTVSNTKAINVFAIDLDQDGDIDIVAAAPYPNAVDQTANPDIVWYENNGSESFTKHTVSISLEWALSVFAIDVDNDGDIDILSASMDDDKIVWHENNGSESFTARTITSSAESAHSVFAIDVDNDGDIDVMSANTQGNYVELYINDGLQNFTTQIIDNSFDYSYEARGVFAIDIDNDGDIDIASTSGKGVSWYENTMDKGRVASWSVSDITTNADLATSVFTIDVDSDGDIDILSSSEADDKIAWYENNGSESFTTQIISTDADGAQSVYAVDLDNDGDVDVLSASSNDDKIAWYENDGAADPSFTARTITTNANRAISVYAVDLDNDGDVDVLSASTNGDKIAWYENDGAADPSFTARTISTSANGLMAVYVIDLDNDGDIDVLSASINDDKIAWYENDGAVDPSFTDRTIASNASSSVDVYAIDLDSDGDFDVISTSYSRGIAWYENDGAADPSFTARTITTNTANDVFAIDVDKDGDIDVLSSQISSGKIAWYENNGSESFTERTIATTANTDPKDVFAIDIDNDGDTDILSATASDDKITLYKNNYDDVVPTITSITSSSSDGAYKIGDAIPITINWSEATVVAGSPKLKLETGSTDQYASYSSGSGSTSLVFNYTIAANDTTSDLDYHSTSALELNGGTIQDVVGNTAVLTLPTPGASGSLGANKALVIDGNAPSVLSVTSSKANGGYRAGETIPVSVNFNQTVILTGSNQIIMETGSTDQAASYASGSGTASLVFNYIVSSGDNSNDLDYISATALSAGDGLKDASGNNAVLTLPTPGASGSLSANKNLVIDTTSPTISSVSSSKASAAYKVGESIPINVTFDDNVTVTGVPQITLETGSSDAVVNYASGTGSNDLIFNYTVGASDQSSDLSYISTSALSLNSGTIQDSLGNNAILTLPAPGAPNSLSNNEAIIIDNQSPVVTLDPADEASSVLPSLPLKINFDEYVRFIDNTILTSDNVDALITLKDYNTQGTDIPFNATINDAKDVISIDPNTDFLSEQIIYYSISASLEDSLDHLAPSANATVTMKDVIKPTVTFNPSNGSIKIPGNRDITITFNERMRKIDDSEITNANVASLVKLKGNNVSGADFNFGATINDDKTVITIDPLFDFSANSVVYVGIDAVVEDDADNAIEAASAIFITDIPDVVGPQVVNVTSVDADSSYKGGSSITITVSFDENVIVVGTPQLILETGSANGVANYSSGSGTMDLNFTYNITSEHNTAHLDYESSNALIKNEGTIKDFIGNNANLVLPTPGAENSLSANKTIVIDHFIPVINLVAEGTLTGEDEDYQAVATAMDISWSGMDTISGILKYEYAIGTTLGGTEVKNWTNAATVTSVSLSGIFLLDGIKYYASIRATDKAGNVSTVKTGDGITIDISAPMIGTVNDGIEEDIDTISSTASLSANWSGFSDATSGIANYEFAIGTKSGGTDTKDWTSNGLETSFTLTDITLTYTNTYFVSVKATDKAGNVSRIATSSGVIVDLYPGPPSITSASIENNSTLHVLNNAKVSFTISEPVTAATIELISNLSDTVLGTLNIEEPTKISVDLLAPFTSGDEITVMIDTLTDQLGNTTNNLFYNYNIALIADFNMDSFIDAADLTTLVQGWTNKDLSYELGPTTGEVPNLKPALDGKFDIMDAAVLIRMWHWNLNNNSQSIPRYASMGNPIQYQNKDNSFSIDILENTNAMDLYIDYPNDKVQISMLDQPSNNNNILLTHLDSLSGMFQMAAGFVDDVDKGLDFNYQIHGREDISINVVYRYFDNNGNVLSKGVEEILLKAVPQEFALHENYPNPFNPTTTMRFDLPIQTDAKIMIFNMLGQKVKTFDLKGVSAGYHSVKWNARNDLGDPVGAGVYFYQLQTSNITKTKKMVLLK